MILGYVKNVVFLNMDAAKTYSDSVGSTLRLLNVKGRSFPVSGPLNEPDREEYKPYYPCPICGPGYVRSNGECDFCTYTEPEPA